MSKRKRFVEILERYRPLGIIKAGELLLRPDDALRLADELGQLGIAILGCDGWYYVKPGDDKAIAQDLAADFFVGNDVLQGNDSVQKSVKAVKQFIVTSIPEKTDFISFTFDVPPSWDMVLKEHKQRQSGRDKQTGGLLSLFKEMPIAVIIGFVPILFIVVFVPLLLYEMLAPMPREGFEPVQFGPLEPGIVRETQFSIPAGEWGIELHVHEYNAEYAQQIRVHIVPITETSLHLCVSKNRRDLRNCIVEDGRVWQENTNGAFSVEASLPARGKYYIKIFAYEQQGSYQISVEELTPGIE
ncbi:MAG: hypothetical protein JXJ17_18350 [Anaerolineae bacterium]|nr:hypothetical protein [Anaerolineae bacterium]